jgi:hypothetical protein
MGGGGVAFAVGLSLLIEVTYPPTIALNFRNVGAENG